MRPAELFISVIERREGTDADSTLSELSKVGEICLSNVTFSRGGLYGRFVSVPIIRCDAERWESAEMTCVELKAGFKGTWTVREFFWHKRGSAGIIHTSIAHNLNSA